MPLHESDSGYVGERELRRVMILGRSCFYSISAGPEPTMFDNKLCVRATVIKAAFLTFS